MHSYKSSGLTKGAVPHYMDEGVMPNIGHQHLDDLDASVLNAILLLIVNHTNRHQFVLLPVNQS